MTERRVLIAHVPYEHRGGEDVHVETLADAYSRIGITPIFYPSSRQPVQHSLSSAAASLIPGRAPKDLCELWERERPAFIHLHNAFPVLGPGFFQWTLDRHVPLLMTVHNHRFFCTNGLALRDGKACKDCFNTRIGWRPLVHNCNQSIAKSGYHAIAVTEMRSRRLYEGAVRKFIAPSPYVASELSRFGIPQERIEWIPNFVPTSYLSSKKPTRRFDVLFAGRLSPEKGVLPLLEIFQAQLPDLRLGIIGVGPEEFKVREFVAKNPNVTVFGALPREEVLRLIEETGIGVLPSICNEILPTFVLECFFQGKRCVMADQESVRWLARDGFPGRVASLSVPQEFAAAIRETLAQSQLESKAIEMIQETFSFDSFCSRLGKLAGEMAK